jgi:anti-sigma-K factor RskA
VDIQDIISSGLLELYAAGLTSAEESAQVQAWVKQYPEVAAELKAIELGLEDYAQANAVAPGAGVKDKLFAQINTPVTSANGNDFAKPVAVIPIKNYWKWAVAASVILLLGSATMNFIYFNKLTTANNNLQLAQEKLSLASEQMTDMNKDMEVVHSPYSMPVSLKGQEAMPDATAKIFWMQNTKEVMVDASNLPDAPSGMQYQFWAIVDGKAVDGGMIITNDKGKKFRMQKMKSFGRAEFFAISLEKEGGSPVPTKVVSMGKI